MGNAILSWLQGEALPLIAVGLIVFAIFLAFQRKWAGFIVTIGIFAIAGAIALNPLGITTFLGGVVNNILSRAG